jgi:HK97 family phage prohead protease
MMSNNREVRFQGRELRVSKADDGSRSITGYAAVFNTPSLDFGGWYEMIAPTAFTRSLQEQPDVLALYSHDNSLVLGRTKSGTLALEVDSVGLKFTCKLPDTTVANDMVVSIERGGGGGH